MASDMNRSILVGRLTRDPELRAINSGTSICRFSLASNETIYKKDADNEERTNFIDCFAWGKFGEMIAKYAQKGRRVGVDGSLSFSSWETPEGKKASKVEIKVENFQFLDSKGSDNSSTESKPETPETPSEPFNDDIPF